MLLTDPVAADVIVATRAASAQARAVLARALVELHAKQDGAAVLRDLFQASSLVAVDPADYAPVKAALRAVGVRV